jgi:3-phenylpropionate/trans-cinnamate dioxygenase ferredoxin subunit
VPLIDVCPVDELPPGQVKIVYAGSIAVGVYNLNGEYFGLEDRCSHDDGPLCEGDFDADDGIAICPRHGANIDIRSGRALTLPAVEAVATFPVRVENETVKLQLP